MKQNYSFILWILQISTLQELRRFHHVANERKNEALASAKFRLLAACFVQFLMVY